MIICEIPYHVTWPIRQKVMWPNKSEDYVKLINDPDGVHYGMNINGEVVAVISLFIDKEEAQFRKFATLKNHQGKGYGTRLLEDVLVKLIPHDVKRVWCNARKEKMVFYERFGMQSTEQFFSRGGIEYVIMDKILR